MFLWSLKFCNLKISQFLLGIFWPIKYFDVHMCTIRLTLLWRSPSCMCLHRYDHMDKKEPRKALFDDLRRRFIRDKQFDFAQRETLMLWRTVVPILHATGKRKRRFVRDNIKSAEICILSEMSKGWPSVRQSWCQQYCHKEGEKVIG